MRAIEDNPLHADDAVSEEQAAIAADDLGEEEETESDAGAGRSWWRRLLGR